MPQSTDTEFPVRDTAVRMELTSGATASDTTLSVNRIIGFDDSDTPFLARLWEKQPGGFREDYSEYIRVDGVDEQNNSLTVTRDYEGIGAVSPSEGDPIQPMIVKADVFDSNATGASETVVNRTLDNLVRSERNRIEFLQRNSQSYGLTAVGGDASIFDIHDEKENPFRLENLIIRDIINDGATDGFAVLSPGVEVYDFERGDIDKWDISGNYSNNFSVDSSTVISGNYSGKIQADSNTTYVQITGPSQSYFLRENYNLRSDSTISDSIKINPSIKVRIGSDVGDSNDYVAISLSDEVDSNFSLSDIGTLYFEDGSNDLVWDGNNSSSNNTVLSSNFWSPNTNYEVEFKIDYQQDEVEVFVNGTKQGSAQNLENPITGFKNFEITNRVSTSNTTRNLWIDDVTTTAGFQSSGTLKSKLKSLYQEVPGFGFTYPPEEAYLSLNADIPGSCNIDVDLKDGYGNNVNLKNGEMVDTSQLESGIVRAEETFTSSGGEKTPFQRSYAVHLREGTGNWNDVISDSFFDRSKISNTSNVQVRTEGAFDFQSVYEKKNADKEAKLSPKTNIDDFEDGNTDGLIKQNTSTTFIADSSTVISGNYSGKLVSDPNNNDSGGFTEVASLPIGKVSQDVWFSVRIGRDTGNTSDGVSFVLFERGGQYSNNYIGQLRFEDSTNDLIWSANNSNTIGSDFWSPNTNYQVQLEMDYANDSVIIYVNGNQLSLEDFANSASHVDIIEVSNDASDASNPRSIWIDDLTVRDGGPGSGFETSGSFEKATTTNLGYVPSSVQIKAPRTVPADESIEVDLTDENNNTDTFTDGDFGSKQSLSNITGSDIDVTWKFTSSDGQDTPRIEEYEIRFFK